MIKLRKKSKKSLWPAVSNENFIQIFFSSFFSSLDLERFKSEAKSRDLLGNEDTANAWPRA